MAKSKGAQPHVNTQRLKSLVAEYGEIAVMEATGYTAGSLSQYLRASGPVIPLVKLNIAIKYLSK